MTRPVAEGKSQVRAGSRRRFPPSGCYPGPDVGRSGSELLVPGWPVLLVGRFEFLRLFVGQFEAECVDGLGRWWGLVAPTIGAETSGLRKTHARAIWAMLTPRDSASFCTALITGSS